MKTFIIKSKTVFSFTVVVFFLFFASSCKRTHNDEDIQTSVNKQLQDNPDFKGVSAQVKNGVLTLSGKCKGQGCDTLIEKQVKATDGVKSVTNDIKKDDATDLTLRTMVQTIVSKYDGVQADVAGGAIVLRGSIDKKQLQPLMNELQALKPRMLDNQLALK